MALGICRRLGSEERLWFCLVTLEFGLISGRVLGVIEEADVESVRGVVAAAVLGLVEWFR